MRGRRNLLPGLLAGLAALLGILVAIPVNVVSGYLPAEVTVTGRCGSGCWSASSWR